jgi:polysaccharide export outer membrane protein
MAQRTCCILITLATSAVLAGGADSPSARSYVLGPDDQISVRVLNLDEIGPQPVRIDLQGYINVALVGRIHAGGLTVELLETEIAKRLKSYVLSPTVSVTIMEYHSQPISILGAVNQPGVHQLQGHKT